MKNGSTWFPNPSSWFSALILCVLMGGIVSILRRNENLLLNLPSDRPEQLTITLIFLLLLPIPAIAFFHHFFLSRLIPAIPGEKVNQPQGFIPGLISWWESLYGWLVIVLSSLSATLLFSPLLPALKLNYQTIIYGNSQPQRNIQITFALIWLTIAAIFYQIEHLVKLRLVFGDSSSNEEVDTTVSQQPNDTDVTQIQSTEQPETKKLQVHDFITKHRKLPKKIFTLVLISLVSLWLYMFVKLPQVRQTISTNLAIENPTLVTSRESSKVNSPSPSPTLSATPEDDTYDRAMKKAKRAVKLTKTAQSPSEWQIVMNRWEEAIKLMEAVPGSSPNYATAQEKILKYQIHREFAKHNAGFGEIER
ncbi:hypothetical protein [Iningainema tapete]|uniref:Uncharacterized protein n=1 Tax=Iningainema tapete BLCC-T55 TaxID=2748662 RepID=A0A8J6XCT3_9CYAN|nr:hypothetical protein [Iningainema tapete]MBD2770605.1 hypothetical protein [Iningainema tapete BLCC-T55]